ncbi:MAG: IPT/TIG domain-containing protein [Solirubrobacterales bacterium]
MSGTAKRTRTEGSAESRAADRAVARLRDLGAARRLFPTLLAIFLLAAVAVSGSAQGRPLGPVGVRVAAETSKAPIVTKQPVSVTVEEGQAASFITTASGVPTPTVQWEVSTNGGGTWSEVAGATAPTLTIASTKTSESGDQFRAVYKNVAGEATSKAATLTVHKAPAVTRQPVGITVEEGQNAVFEATASGSPAPTVKWETSANGGTTWTAVAGGTSDQLTIVGAKTSISGHQYRATFKNVVSTAISEAATLTVQKAPSVTKQPASLTVDEGQSATFEATGSGFPTPTVQWEISTDGGGTWSAVEGATANQLTIASTLTSEDGHKYRAVFTNAAGSVTSATVTLTVHAPPVVTQQPAGTTIEVGEGAVFEAAASGYPTPTVQWEISTNNGSSWSAVPGATANQLAVEKAQASESGHEYRATFTNAAGKATSNEATLTVATNHFAAVAWGSNLYKQLGDGFKEQLSDVPVPVTGLKFVTAVAAGAHHSLALLANGTVVAWGGNGFGQLGDGSTTESSVPVAVHGLSGVKAIAAGASHSLALLTNGTVMAWGDNESGQLGIGTAAEDSELPVAVTGLTGVKAIAAGANYSLALLTNGTAMAWGDNESGQLGTGNTKSSNAPVAVKALTGVSAISAGSEFALALLTNQTVKAWGNDEKGQLGNVTVEEAEATSSDVPVVVETLSGVRAVAAGANHGLATLSGGTVMGWGDDSFGELGNGTIKARETTPVAVSGLSGVTAISAGGQNSAAVLGSGSVMTWGTDASGVLGDGVPGGMSDVPVAVVGLAKAASISAGRFDMLAFGEPIPVVTSVSPQIGPAAGGATVTISGNTFTGATAVKFGTAEATSFTVESATSITATAPPGTGTVNVTVTTPAGMSPPSAADRYTYQAAPTVTILSTKSGPAAGGTIVTITGTEFATASKVAFGQTSAVEFTINSPTSITAVAPAAVGGTVDVSVTNVDGTSASSSKDHFKYVPAVEGVSPNAGSTHGGESVTVTGNGFALGNSATVFMFGKVKAKSVNCTSSTSCTVTTPAQVAGTVDVKATVNKAISPINAGDHFTYS